jgi:GMP synthase (glutamine-hydrolysing)
MKRPILIIENYPGRGDCIVRLLSQFRVPFELTTSDGSALTVPPRVAGIILSGGPQSVTKIDSDEGIRLRPVLDILNLAEQRRLPVLGICLGHQLLGTWAGGEVAKLPAKVVGFKEISLLKQSAIFDRYADEKIVGFQFHEDHLRSLPKSCQVLASSKSCDIEAFVVRDRQMWGVQFHPEVTFADGTAIFDNEPLPLRPWVPGSDVNGPYLIKSFAELCGRNNGTSF